MTAIVCAVLLLAGVVQWVWKRLRRQPAEPADEPFVFDTRDPEDEPPAWGRSEREVHGMTAPEVAETRERFDALIEANWPTQT